MNAPTDAFDFVVRCCHRDGAKTRRPIRAVVRPGRKGLEVLPAKVGGVSKPTVRLAEEEGRGALVRRCPFDEEGIGEGGVPELVKHVWSEVCYWVPPRVRRGWGVCRGRGE